MDEQQTRRYPGASAFDREIAFRLDAARLGPMGWRPWAQGTERNPDGSVDLVVSYAYEAPDGGPATRPGPLPAQVIAGTGPGPEVVAPPSISPSMSPPTSPSVPTPTVSSPPPPPPPWASPAASAAPGAPAVPVAPWAPAAPWAPTGSPLAVAGPREPSPTRQLAKIGGLAFIGGSVLGGVVGASSPIYAVSLAAACLGLAFLFAAAAVGAWRRPWPIALRLVVLLPAAFMVLASVLAAADEIWPSVIAN